MRARRVRLGTAALALLLLRLAAMNMPASFDGPKKVRGCDGVALGAISPSSDGRLEAFNDEFVIELPAIDSAPARPAELGGVFGKLCDARRVAPSSSKNATIWVSSRAFHGSRSL